MAETQATTLSRQWLFKTGAFTVVLLAFGFWGLGDAAIFYPRRGMADASFQFKNWLQAADAAGRLNTAAFILSDPHAALADLEKKEADLRAAAQGDGSSARAAATDVAKLEYLRSLARVWRLDTHPKLLGQDASGNQFFYDPTAGNGYAQSAAPAPSGPPAKTTLTLDSIRQDLINRWKSSNQPTPLSGYDLPVQWCFVVIGFGTGLCIILIMFRAKLTASKIRWDPAAQRLTLPDGSAITPADLSEVDKRLWHKYFVTLITRDGAKHKLDLLRFTPLEDWVLTLERTAFPESAQQAEPAPTDASASPESAPRNAEA